MSSQRLCTCILIVSCFFNLNIYCQCRPNLVHSDIYLFGYSFKTTLTILHLLQNFSYVLHIVLEHREALKYNCNVIFFILFYGPYQAYIYPGICFGCSHIHKQQTVFHNFNMNCTAVLFIIYDFPTGFCLIRLMQLSIGRNTKH